MINYNKYSVRILTAFKLLDCVVATVTVYQPLGSKNTAHSSYS